MAIIEFITKGDLIQFKLELLDELRRPGQKLHKESEQKEWLKSYEVLKLLDALRLWVPTFCRRK